MIYETNNISHCLKLKTLLFHLCNGVFTVPDSDSCADADSCIDRVTIDVKGMASETLLNIIIKPNSLCLGTGIGLGIGVGHCK